MSTDARLVNGPPTGAPPPRGRRRLLRVLAIGLSVLLVLALLAVGGIGWYFSSQVLQVGASGQAEVSIHADGEGRAVLSREGYAAFVGEHGVRVRGPAEGARGAEGGQDGDGGEVDGHPVVGVVGDIVDDSGDEVVREWHPVSGELPEEPVRAVIDQDVYWPDPSAVDVPFSEVVVTSDVGDLPAWLVEGRGEAAGTWAIFVHGRGGTVRESLRFLPTLHGAGVTTLVPSYRNDPGAPPDPSGQYRLGETEWKDVEASISYARAGGARQVLLLGWSMGGALVMQAVDRSPEARIVTGLWLDAPVLDWRDTLDAQGRLNGLPQPLTAVAQWLVQLRGGIELADFDWPERADELPAVPIHIEHSDQDTFVPNGSSVALADARPDIVTLVSDSRAEHTREWNADPDGYDARLAGWLADRVDG